MACALRGRIAGFCDVSVIDLAHSQVALAGKLASVVCLPERCTRMNCASRPDALKNRECCIFLPALCDLRRIPAQARIPEGNIERIFLSSHDVAYFSHVHSCE